jgi:hypothetical protein
MDELCCSKPELAQKFGKEFIVGPLRAARAALSGPGAFSGLETAKKKSHKECFHLYLVK